MSTVTPAKSKTTVRYRPFRRVVYGVYLAVVVAFCLLTIVSVFRSASAMSPPSALAEVRTVPVAQCVREAEQLWASLDNERKGFTQQRPAHQVDDKWTQFRLNWMQRYRSVEAQCALKSGRRDALNRAFQRLERLMDLYTTHAVQYAGEVGGVVDNFATSLDEAKRTGAD